MLCGSFAGNAKALAYTDTSALVFSIRIACMNRSLPWRRALKSKIGTISVDRISDAHTHHVQRTHTRSALRKRNMYKAIYVAVMRFIELNVLNYWKINLWLFSVCEYSVWLASLLVLALMRSLSLTLFRSHCSYTNWLHSYHILRVVLCMCVGNSPRKYIMYECVIQRNNDQKLFKNSSARINIHSM